MYVCMWVYWYSFFPVGKLHIEPQSFGKIFITGGLGQSRIRYVQWGRKQSNQMLLFEVLQKTGQKLKALLCSKKNKTTRFQAD